MKTIFLGIGAILVGLCILLFAYYYNKKRYKSANQPIGFESIATGIGFIILGILMILNHNKHPV